jgi:hypothetical protein
LPIWSSADVGHPNTAPQRTLWSDAHSELAVGVKRATISLAHVINFCFALYRRSIDSDKHLAQMRCGAASMHTRLAIRREND